MLSNFITPENASDIYEHLQYICRQINCSIISKDEIDAAKDEASNSIDATWQMRSAFVIMTMQSGFALLEAGFVGKKNLANIMAKNTADVGIGGLIYWLLGYGLSFGEGGPFAGTTHFGNDACNNQNISGTRCTQYFFQFSFASTANTILSGAVAERMSLLPYILFSAANEISYCLPVRWAWSDNAWLFDLGFYDLAGSCVVHMNGGISALVAAAMIGARTNRWTEPKRFGMVSPVTALTGTLLLWWSWFSFNCGSTLGTTGNLWKMNALIGINTLNGSVGGTCTAILVSMLAKKGIVDVTWLINGILGSLVATTGICSVTSPLESLIVGVIGSLIAIGTSSVLEKWQVDDPVGAVPVHFFAAVWGTLAVGIFGRNDEFGTLGRDGFIHGGGFYLLGVQALGLLAIGAWSAGTTFIFMLVIDLAVGLRLTPYEEERGADECEHGITGSVAGLRGLVAGGEHGLVLGVIRGRGATNNSNRVTTDSREEEPAGFFENRAKRRCVKWRIKVKSPTDSDDVKVNTWITSVD